MNLLKSLFVLFSIATLGASTGSAQGGLLCPGQEAQELAPSGDGKVIFLVCGEIRPNKTGDQLTSSPSRYHAYRYEVASKRVEELIADADIQLFASPVGESFIAEVRGQKPRLVLVAPGHAIRELVANGMLPYGGVWNSDGTKFFFAADMTEEGEGFDTLGVLDVTTWVARTAHLHATSELLAYCPIKGRVLTQNWHNSSREYIDGADEYDEMGKYIGPSILAGPASANCKYSATWAGTHGPEDWAVYSDSRRPLARFSSTVLPVQFFGAWNPVYDELLTIEGEQKTDVYDLKQEKVIRSFVGGPYHWSSDGRSIAIFQNHKLVFETIAP